MNHIRRDGPRVVIRQIPWLLLFVGFFLGGPMIAASVYQWLEKDDPGSAIFCLLFGSLVLWLFLEFVATRERFDIDLESKELKRTVSGLFRRKEETIDLGAISGIGVEKRPDSRGRRHQYLYLYGNGEKFLVNSPAKMYLDHGKMGKILNEATLIPYLGEKEFEKDEG
jgi:hypothetical protein